MNEKHFGACAREVRDLQRLNKNRDKGLKKQVVTCC